MAEIDTYISEFKNLVDRKARLIGTTTGERGTVGRILRNPDENIYYYVYFVTRWFDTFGYQFRDKVPECDRNSKGISVAITDLKKAVLHGNSYISIIYEDQRDLVRYYHGCHANCWDAYFTSYDTIWIKREIDKIPQACIPLRLLFRMEGFKN